MSRILRCMHCSQYATCEAVWYADPNDQHEGRDMGPRHLCDDCAHDLRKSERKGRGVSSVKVKAL